MQKQIIHIWKLIIKTKNNNIISIWIETMHELEMSQKLAVNGFEWVKNIWK